MKFNIFIFVCSSFLFFGCSNNNVASDKKKETIANFIKLGGDRKLPYSKRIFYNQKVLPILLSQDNDSLNREALIKVAKNFYFLNSWIDLKRASQVLLNKGIQKNDAYHIGQSYKWLGVYYENVSINDSAFYYFSKAEKRFKILNAYKELCEIYTNKALLQYYVNDYLGSQQSAIKALKISKTFHFIEVEYDCYMCLQMNSCDLHDYKSAIDYCKKTLALINNNTSVFKSQDISFSLKAIGYNYYQWGKIPEAIKNYEVALQEKKHSILYSSSYCTLLDYYGQALLRIGKIRNVEYFFIRASKIRDSLKIDQGKNYNRLFLSELYSIKGDSSKTLKYAKEAYVISKDFKNPKDMLACLKQLTKVDPKNALKYTQEYIRISDSMQQLERQTRDKFAKIAYETEEITNEKDQAVKQKWIFFSITVLIFFVGILLFIVVTQLIKQKELQFLQEQQKSNEEFYQLIQNQQTKIDDARQIEKKRIAQDLHDGIMNRLASTRLNLHVLKEKNDQETIKKCLPFIDGIQNIEKEIRNIAHDLNKEVFDTNDGFLSVLESFFEEQRRTSKAKAHFEIDNSINWDAFESSKKIHLYRMLQEALNNCNKHAQAENIVVSILNRESHILLEIYDDGIGFSFKQKKKGIGLQNIFSRAKTCGGLVEIKSNKGAGTTIIITIPIGLKSNNT